MEGSRRSIRFVDLFAGLGGFHVGLSRVRDVDARCVFACELDEALRALYEQNFRQECHGDITELDASDVPAHEVLCAGFPCQPFSKAGEQRGLACGENGSLFEEHLLPIIRHHLPPLLLLENVPNLERHDDGYTWQRMRELLEHDELGYQVDSAVLSPDGFGVPQVRQRMYIVASRVGRRLEQFKWPTPTSKSPSIKSVLRKDPKDVKTIPDHYEAALEIWGEFLHRFRNTKLPSFPIWAMEFGATYPFERTTPARCQLKELQSSQGAFGRRLRGLTRRQAFEGLPPYARERDFPTWKRAFIRQNRELHASDRSWINGWKKQLKKFHSSLQKLEWNCQGEEPDIWNYVIQFRASGIRVKRPTSAPALVAMTSTQVPVIAWQRRYMTMRECASLQCLGSLRKLPSTQGGAVRALGNAVNAKMVKLIARELLAATPASAIRAARRVPAHA